MEAEVVHDRGLRERVTTVLQISKAPSKRELRDRGGFGNLTLVTTSGATYTVPWRYIYSVHIR